METLHDFGHRLIALLQEARSPGMDALFSGISFLGDEPFYLLLIPILYWTVDRAVALRITVLLLVSTWLNGLGKALVDLPRPSPAQVAVLADEPTGGVPSGHAQNAVVVWGYLASLRPGVWSVGAAVLAALAIGTSRLYLGVHFPHDLVAGWALGLALLFAFLRLRSRVEGVLAGVLRGGGVLDAPLLRGSSNGASSTAASSGPASSSGSSTSGDASPEGSFHGSHSRDAAAQPSPSENPSPLDSPTRSSSGRGAPPLGGSAPNASVRRTPSPGASPAGGSHPLVRGPTPVGWAVLVFLGGGVPLLMLLLYRQHEALPAAAALLGAGLGAVWERTRIRFSPRGPLLDMALRVALGLGVALGIWIGLREPLGAFGDPGRILRYVLLGGWITAGAPLAFIALGFGVRDDGR